MATSNGNSKPLAELLDDLDQHIIELAAIKQAARDVKLTHHAYTTLKDSAVKTHPDYYIQLEDRLNAYELAFSNLLELI